MFLPKGMQPSSCARFVTLEKNSCIIRYKLRLLKLETFLWITLLSPDANEVISSKNDPTTRGLNFYNSEYSRYTNMHVSGNRIDYDELAHFEHN